MNISLTPKLEDLVNKKVASGLYGSASEVIREGLRLLDEQDRLRGARLQALRDKIDKGLEQLDRGEAIPGEKVFRDLREKSKKLRARRR